MQKEVLEKICSASDLRKYENSKEYKDILEWCKNKAETIKMEILSFYENNKQNLTLTEYDFHDRSWKMLKFYETILTKIQSSTKWAKALRQELENDIENLKTWITWSPIDKFLNVYSSIKLTKLDMLRSEKSFNENFKTILNGLINTLEPPKLPEEESVY